MAIDPNLYWQHLAATPQNKYTGMLDAFNANYNEALRRKEMERQVVMQEERQRLIQEELMRKRQQEEAQRQAYTNIGDFFNNASMGPQQPNAPEQDYRGMVSDYIMSNASPEMFAAGKSYLDLLPEKEVPNWKDNIITVGGVGYLEKTNDGTRFVSTREPNTKPRVPVREVERVDSQGNIVMDIYFSDESVETVTPPPKGKQGGGTLPASLQSLQQDSLDAISLADGLVSDLGTIKQQVSSGQLKLGLKENLISEGKNIIGKSDENSRNYQSFKSSLQKLRNDSLRLNKGVQTEGDAQRAWKELLDNINDPDVVQDRLEEIINLNSRAKELHKNKITQLRSDANVGGIDFSPYENQRPAIVSGNDFQSAAQAELERRRNQK